MVNNTQDIEEELLTEEHEAVEEAADNSEAPVGEEPFDETGDEEDFLEKYPECEGLTLCDKEKYAALRKLGLTHSEAYGYSERREITNGGRVHLTGSIPGGASVPALGMSRSELAAARELFGDLSDSEIQSLYKKVTR